MRKSFRRNLRGVSPVIATIIIVAIAIVMSIAVAYWMLGLGAAFTRFEKLEFTSGYATYNVTLAGFDIKMKLKNTGSAALTIDQVFINGVPWGDIAAADKGTENLIGTPLAPGGEKLDGLIQLKKGTTYVSGMTVEVLVRTAAGRDFPKVIVLP